MLQFAQGYSGSVADHAWQGRKKRETPLALNRLPVATSGLSSAVFEVLLGFSRSERLPDKGKSHSKREPAFSLQVFLFLGNLFPGLLLQTDSCAVYYRVICY